MSKVPHPLWYNPIQTTLPPGPLFCLPHCCYHLQYQFCLFCCCLQHCYHLQFVFFVVVYHIIVITFNVCFVVYHTVITINFFCCSPHCYHLQFVCFVVVYHIVITFNVFVYMWHTLSLGLLFLSHFCCLLDLLCSSQTFCYCYHLHNPRQRGLGLL